jgi:hypothetical protein
VRDQFDKESIMESLNSKDSQREQDAARISHRISGVFFWLIGAFGAMLIAAVMISPNGGSSQPAPVATKPVAQVVTVAMHDPGCHWFQVNGDYRKSLSVSGPVKLQNIDEAALEIKGSQGVKTDAVGKSVALDPGSYRITMVDQAPDDNTLNLTVQ